MITKEVSDSALEAINGNSDQSVHKGKKIKIESKNVF